MKNGLIRCLKNDIYTLGVLILQIGLMSVAFYIVYNLGDLKIGGEMVLLFAVITPSMAMVNRCCVGIKSIVGFSCTRKNFLYSGLIIKLLYVIISAGAAFGLTMLNPELPFTRPLALVSFTLVVLCMAFLGEFNGMLIQFYGKMGFVVYILTFCVVIFGCIGGFIGYMVASGNRGSMVLSLTEFIEHPLAIVIPLVLSIVFFIINLMFTKKITVKN